MERIYLDTSVFGGFFEPEFDFWTKILFDKINAGEYRMLYSQMTEIELENAPSHIKDFSKSISSQNIEFISISTDARNLAAQYINENVVGKTSLADCIHIALATLNNADILTSWNFKHIVNVSRIRGYNSVNYKLGHKILEIRTPREIVES